MNETKSELLELIALTELHLFQEYEKGSWLTVERDSYESLKNFAKKATPPKPAPPQTKPSAPQQKPLTPNNQKTTLPSSKIPLLEKEPEKKEFSPPHPKEEPKTPPSPKLPTFDLHELASPNVDDFKEMRKMIARLFPHLSILDLPPESPEKNDPHLTQVVILFSDERPSDLLFLQNLAQAIRISLHLSVSLLHAEKDIEKEFHPNLPKLLICHENALEKLHKSSHQLSRILVPTLKEIENNPFLKADLWKKICKFLISSS